ncbi:DNA-binding GntR family transcriptional regulator [Rhizobium sp. BK313]|uniref:GntR family transcriptional regulator n=1 Tax=Rhizobium sp. BK313 TaxID=2587081 RepID=UPI001060E3DD|nr:GntR family transcriptional regulator [Rhizobium sp. BK313]MBB3454510.1 DNA-binding GntR family transcriptional regulator [Rhizobium sp. BK313]
MDKPSQNLVETIYSDLRLRLQRSEVSPSDRLVDTEIADSYGISRMPAREALLRLVSEGYLIGTTRGFAVRELSLADISGLFEVRRQLEPRAAASAARDMTPDVEAALTDAISRIEQTLSDGNIPGLLAANVDFRNTWLRAVTNPHMAVTISRFMDYFQSVRLGTFADPAVASRYIDGLSAIHRAFLAHDPLAVHDRMTLFMFAAEEAYLSVRRRQLEEAEAIHPIRRRRK